MLLFVTLLPRLDSNLRIGGEPVDPSAKERMLVNGLLTASDTRFRQNNRADPRVRRPY